MNMNKTGLSESNAYYVSMGLLQPKQALDDKYDGKLEIHLTPYTEISANVEAVMEALSRDALLMDQHNVYEGYKPNRFKTYALFNHRGVLAICPISESNPTSLNPVRVDQKGNLSLSTGSIGTTIYKHQLKELVDAGYLAGYVKVL